MTKIGFAGLTHLGINSAVATAERGWSVIGYDADVELTKQLSMNQIPFKEPGLNRLALNNSERLHFSSDIKSLNDCSIVYVSADVPTDNNGASDLTSIRELIDSIIPHLNDQAIMVVLCQVPPGFTRSINSISSARLVYQVETLIFGKAVERALNPERFIVGCSNPEAVLPVAYKSLLESFNCPILQMRFESAELAKIAINFCLVASISVANALAEVSEVIGADWLEVVPALRLDKRIGPHSYLVPGLGLSGGNLERDLRTILDISSREDIDASMIEAWMSNSKLRKDWCWRKLKERVLAIEDSPRIAVLGLAYKENTNSTKNSPSLQLLSHLNGYDLSTHDPVVVAGSDVNGKQAESVLDCISGADVMVLSTPWPEYRELSLGDIKKQMRGRVVIDPFRLLNGQALFQAGFEYHALGMPSLIH